jgi:Do/DeqQ family serine protease
MGYLKRTVKVVSFFYGLINALHAQELTVPNTKESLIYSYASVVEKVAPAVVNIYAAHITEQPYNSPFLNDPIFRHFFGDGVPGRAGSRLQSSLGSGVIVDPKGIVITNYHVIKDAKEIKVVLQDGRELEAEIAVQDKRTDLVALQIKEVKHELPYLQLRDADELLVGDIVLAFGNPFGFGHTVTSGIVSGLARTELGVNDFRSFIQTDAAINPGNSGGPLVTLDGKLVGINTAIFSNTGGSIGISFAIPSNLVAPVVASVGRGSKRVIRPWIGLRVQALTPEIRQSSGVNEIPGVLVQKVFEGSSAQLAGVLPGDIIMKIGKHDIKNESSYRFRVATLQVGTKTIFTLIRDAQEKLIDVVLKAPPALTDNKKADVAGRNPLSGSSVSGLSPALAEDLGIFYEEGGVVIYHIRNGSLARLNGLLPGDVIVQINSHKIRTVDELLRNLSRTRKGWVIEYRRDGQNYKIFVQSW